jgi:lysozyme
MNPESLKVLLEKHEANRLKPYHDSVGKLTIGIGRNLDDVGISLEESYYLLDNDIKKVVQGLDRVLPWWKTISEARQLVLADMAFNLGIGGLLKFPKFLAHCQSAEFDQAADEMLDSRWATQVGSRAIELAKMMRMDVVSVGV